MNLVSVSCYFLDLLVGRGAFKMLWYLICCIHNDREFQSQNDMGVFGFFQVNMFYKSVVEMLNYDL